MTVKQAPKTVFLAICIGTGVFVAALLLSVSLPYIPSDFSRTNTLLTFLKKEAPAQSTLAFGNSIAMDGFDAKSFAQKSCAYPSFNLSSPGQNQLESLLLISTVENKPKRIIHFFNSLDLEKQDYLSRNVIFNFLLYDYRPNAFVKESLGITNNATTLDDWKTNRFQTAFEGRWMVTNYINTLFRKWLRRDLVLDNLANELYYPRNYTSKFPDSQRLPLIKAVDQLPPKTSFHIDSVKLELIKRTSLYLEAKGIEYVIVLSPINPAIKSYQKGYLNGLSSFCESTPFPRTRIINLSSLLTADDFVDHIHPDANGAIKITSEIANQLNECSSRP